MGEHHVIAKRDPLPSGEMRWRFECPECGRQAENSPLMHFENYRTVFCGRWGCDALLHVRRRRAFLTEPPR